MGVKPQLFLASVMHKRLFPKVNGFTYRVYYLACPLGRLAELADGWRFGVNRAGAMGFLDKDHGACDGGALEPWIKAILQEAGFAGIEDVLLITMPRVLGYGFNPVSFWLCLDAQGALRAVLSEVHNTFGERHCYLCAHEDRRIITQQDWLGAEKQFHVSPFMPRSGSYRFRFAYKADADKLGIWIDYYDAQARKQLLTSLTGKLVPYTRAHLRRAFWQVPLLTLKVVGLIHWQAVKLFFKRIRYVPKPGQAFPNFSANLTKKLGDGQETVRKDEL